MLLFSFYILKVITCSGILFAYYWLLLRNKIFHQYNRFYLLASIGLSLLAPLVQINILHNADAPAPTIKLLQVVTSSNEYLDEIVLTAHKNNFTLEQLASLLYVLTTLVFLSLFIQVFIKISTLLKHHQQTVIDNICFVNTTAEGTPFSFLKYIFWNDHIEINTTTGNQIFKHELAHVQQKHSYDKLFINAVLIFFWCNPFFWLVRKELNIIHEFMADKIAVEDSDTEAFAAMILQATYPQHQFALTNPFFYSPIKRRLIMLTKNKNPKASYIGRVLVLPLAVLLFAAFTLKTKTIAKTPVYQGKKITVVLDAGHGGTDFGAVSLDGTTTEKDLALSIIKKIKALNNNNNINIILTRESDIYQSPVEKAAFSKAQNANLFISIHTDAIVKEEAANNHSGISVWIAKDNFANAVSSKLFASAIINEFHKNYQLQLLSDYPQQSEKGIVVLQENSFPSVLIEAGFITNKKDLAYLQTEAAKETIAKNVLAAIEKYALQTETTITNDKVLIDTIPKKNELPDNILYVLNDKIMGSGKEASNKVDKELNNKAFKNLMVKIIKEKEAIIKYGELGKNGAVELSYDPNETTALQSNGSKTVDKAGSNANRNNFDAKSDDKIFTKVENEPKFSGGDSAWKHYLQKNLNPAIPINNGAPAGTYRVIVKFIVSKDGSISNVEPETKHGYGMETAAAELIKKGPKWEPAVQNNLIVTAYKKQPITFVIENQ